MDLAALKTEIETDPEGIGYAGEDDQGVAKLINRGDRETDRETIDASQLAGAVTIDDYDSVLSKKDRDYFDMLISAGSVENTRVVRQQLRELFPAQSDTRKNIRELLKRPGSRAEQIGLGRVTTSDVADARRFN